MSKLERPNDTQGFMELYIEMMEIHLKAGLAALAFSAVVAACIIVSLC